VHVKQPCLHAVLDMSACRANSPDCADVRWTVAAHVAAGSRFECRRLRGISKLERIICGCAPGRRGADAANPKYAWECAALNRNIRHERHIAAPAYEVSVMRYSLHVSVASFFLSLIAAATLASSARSQGFFIGIPSPTPAEPLAAPPWPSLSLQELAARAKARRARELARLAAQEQREEADKEAAIELAKKLAVVLHEKGATAAFMQDTTLRSGDIVVTQTGIRVFQGVEGSEHSPSDFKPVSQLSGPKRASLILLERASGLNRQAANKVSKATAPPPLTVVKHRPALPGA
jgi:hypothetical protein